MKSLLDFPPFAFLVRERRSYGLMEMYCRQGKLKQGGGFLCLFLSQCVCAWQHVHNSTERENEEIASNLQRQCLYIKFGRIVIGRMFQLNLTGS